MQPYKERWRLPHISTDTHTRAWLLLSPRDGSCVLFTGRYGLTPGSPECAGVPPPGAESCGYVTPGCLNSTHWDNLHALAHQSGADFIFGVSFGLPQACAEGATYQWNATNAAGLLRYVIAT